MGQKPVYLGKLRYVNNGIDMSTEFETIARQDEKTADLLCKQGLYNQSM